MAAPIRLWADIRPALLKLIIVRGLSVGDISDATGVPRSTVNDVVSGNTDPQWGTVAKILSAVGVDLAWVHKLGGKSCRTTKGRETTKATPKTSPTDARKRRKVSPKPFASNSSNGSKTSGGSKS